MNARSPHLVEELLECQRAPAPADEDGPELWPDRRDQRRRYQNSVLPLCCPTYLLDGKQHVLVAAGDILYAFRLN